MFSRIKPKLAVYYHIGNFGNRQIKAYSTDELVEMTRKTYSGPLLFGEDLMSFRVTKEGVEVLN